jgi:RimJ/RimL family protein N-acetyltransferase
MSVLERPPDQALPEQPPPPAPAGARASAPVVFYPGRRIYFRPLEMDDEPLLRRWMNDPEIRRGLGRRSPLNGRSEQQWLENLYQLGNENHFGIALNVSDELIGVTGFHRIDHINRSGMVGLAIGERRWQNRGFGREAIRLLLRFAFEELNLNRIGLGVFSNNPRAIRCYQRAGFVLEGCLRDAVFRENAYHHEYRFAMLRREWEAVESQS